MNAATLERVILSWPTVISLASASAGAGGAPQRSWIQLAKTGAFVSSRYGKFAITPEDLTQMFSNFVNITPKAPTELPIDYDHLSMDPKKPGDGAAAGWMKRLELREDGQELWAEVEWTPDGAKRIANREYRFVSPSFVKDHVHKDGTKIGATLLAAAITNHPFLEGMKALTLYNFSTLGDLALASPTAEKASAVVHLAERSQRVGLVDDPEEVPEVTDAERRQTFIVKATIGIDDDQFVRLTTLDGEEFGWFRRTQLAPAPARQKAHDSTHSDITTTEDSMLNDTQKKATAFARRLPANFTADDVRRTAVQHPEEGAAFRLSGLSLETLGPDSAPASTGAVMSLSVREGESFGALCQRHAYEKKISLRQAVREVSLARPDLAAAR